MDGQTSIHSSSANANLAAAKVATSLANLVLRRVVNDISVLPVDKIDKAKPCSVLFEIRF